MLDKVNIPRHIAIIMDGNGRWAKEHGLPRTAGHRKGMNRVEEIIKAAAELGVKVITLFAFSAENWQRPKKEVDMLMRSLDNFLRARLKDLMKNNVRFTVMGRESPLPQHLIERIRLTKDATKNNSGIILNVALNYGARQEIVDAVKKLCRAIEKKEFDLNALNENNFSRFLYAEGLPDPDLLIRTSGEQRISNFLLWQISYTELYFTKKYWPDFGRRDLEEAIKVYQRRQRRFGKVLNTDAD